MDQRCDVNYILANGKQMPHMGENKLYLQTKNGLKSSIKFHITKVKKPLAAVSNIAENGGWVCIGADGAHIVNITSKDMTSMDLSNGTCSLDVDYFTDNNVFRRQE